MVPPAPARLAAQDAGFDRLILQDPDQRGRTTLSGTILDYSGDVVRIRLQTRHSIVAYPAAHVVDVVTTQTQEHIAGLKHWQDGQIDEADAAFSAAMQKEPRAWMVRDLLALLIRCDLRRDDRLAAGRRFLDLVRGDPRTRHFGLIPLVWSSMDVSPPLQSQAREWITIDDPVARLIGTSILLSSQDTRRLANTELEALAICGDARVQDLARAQQWRGRLQDGSLSPTDPDRWHARIRNMPESLRGGPYYVLGQACSQMLEYDRAAIALLRLPLVYVDDHHLAARACLEAADALNSAGRVREAASVWQEVVKRFADTPFAAEARLLLSPRSIDAVAPANAPAK